MKFTYPIDYTNITFENVESDSDIQKILGFGTNVNVKYPLKFD